MTAQSSIKVSGVRIVYPHLFQPWAGPQGTDKPKYQVTLGLTYNQMLEMWNAEEALIAANYPDPSRRPANLQRWLRPISEKPGVFESEPGVLYFIKVGSKFPPGVYGPDAQKIQDPSDARVYGGATAIFHGSPFLYKTPRIGISWNLFNIQIIGGGNPLGLSAPEAGFSAVSYAGPQPPAMNQPPPPPGPPAPPQYHPPAPPQQYPPQQYQQPAAPAPAPGMHPGYSIDDILRR